MRGDPTGGRGNVGKAGEKPSNFAATAEIFYVHINAALGGCVLSELPEDTTMRREIKRRLIAGTPLEIGSGYIIASE